MHPYNCIEIVFKRHQGPVEESVTGVPPREQIDCSPEVAGEAGDAARHELVGHLAQHHAGLQHLE